MKKNAHALNSLFHAIGNSTSHHRTLIPFAIYYHGKYHGTNLVSSALFAVALAVAFLGVLSPAVAYFDAVALDSVVPDAACPVGLDVAVPDVVVPDAVVPDAVVPDASASTILSLAAVLGFVARYFLVQQLLKV